MKRKIFTIIIAAALFAAAASGCSGQAGKNAGPERPVSERESGLAGTGSDASAIAPIPGAAAPPSSGGAAASGKVASPVPSTPQNWSDMRIDHSMELLYADQFSVDYYDNGFAMITIADDNRYLVVPEGETVPGGLPDGVTVIRRPLNNIYLVATSAMDLFCSLDAVDRITLSGTDASGWYIREARQAIESGAMSYAGKYNAPDYELILSKSCDLAVESTMIYHSPEVKEQLETLGIPVLFDRQMSALNAVMGQEPTGKTVAFFYVSSNGYVNVRKPGDYVAKMIELAGGTYAPQNSAEPENALSTMNMQMEAFYAAARDADYIIYNSTIDGELKSLDALLAKSSLLADFKAVKEGHVWCTEKNLFQESMGLGTMILDIHRMLTEEDPDPSEMTYIYPLR